MKTVWLSSVLHPQSHVFLLYTVPALLTANYLNQLCSVNHKVKDTQWSRGRQSELQQCIRNSFLPMELLNVIVIIFIKQHSAAVINYLPNRDE